MKGFEAAYQKLNEAQKRAVDTIEGPVLVVAGPGSGKTEILALRVAHILQKTDTPPSGILCLTFTEAAAANMRARLESLIGRDAFRVSIYTFHSFGVSIINRFPDYFYGGAEFRSADDITQLEILETLISQLDANNPLRKEHPERGFIFLKPLQKAISHLKRAGITPDEFRSILNHNEKFYKAIESSLNKAFNDRLTQKKIEDIKKVLSKAEAYTEKPFPIEHMRSMRFAFISSLRKAVDESVNDHSMAPLSAWKTRWLERNDQGQRILKDQSRLERMRSLADVYESYQTIMHEQGYYDFDDMLLDTVQAISNSEALKNELQEMYQYVLVDEFQDTNDVQMRFLHLLADADINDEQPNIMVVGDDDQAIYKFQGAEVSNILRFGEAYRDPVVVSLQKNYRSTQNILDLATYVIEKGEERLVNLFPDIQKELEAHHDRSGSITNSVFQTSAHEYHFVAEKVHERIQSGEDPKSIAVIARHHRELEEVVKYLHERDVPVRYERKQNVLLEPHIHQLIQIARFIQSLARKNEVEADNLLPEILSYPFWSMSRETIWRLSVTAGRERKLWLDVMLDHEDEFVRRLGAFFLELKARAQYEPVEYIIDALIGGSYPDDEDRQLKQSDTGFVSPFRKYYFSRERFNEERQEYLIFLSSLRVFVQALREYKQGQPLKLDDLVLFVDLHKKNGIAIVDRSPFVNAENAVNVMTAHSAKGLEFKTVFVIGCVDDIWAGRPRPTNLPFPMNLPIRPAGETLDDQLRLFYVALTRAKEHLFITSHRLDSQGRRKLRLRFLVQNKGEQNGDSVSNALKLDEVSSESAPELLVKSWHTYHAKPPTHDERSLLQSWLEGYQLSVTHLNNFLDVSRGGPQLFLENNLLRFPKAKTPGSAFGSAMHRLVERLYTHTKKLPTIAAVKKMFDEEIERERLSDRDLKTQRKRGHDALSVWYPEKKKSLDARHQIEVRFKDQGVVVGDAHLTGVIDKLVIDKKTNRAVVHDFKTGQPKEKWAGHSVHQRIQLHHYRTQLVFYKLLIENSRDFGMFNVNRGVIEFLEPLNNRIIDLGLDISDEDVDRLKQLIEVVYYKIMHLDFPNIDEYPKDIKGIKAFEDDLIKK